MNELNWTYLNETINNTETITTINQTIINLEQTINTQQTIIWTLIGLLTISILGYYFIRNQLKLSRKYKEVADQTIEEIGQLIKDLKNDKSIKQIDIKDYPTKIKQDILDTTGKWGKIFSKLFYESEKDGHKPPFMLLLRNDMTAELKQNVKEGELILRGKDKLKTQKRIIISRQKLFDLKLPNGKWKKLWVHYEDEAEGYPHEPRHLSKAMYYLIEAIQMNKTPLKKPFKFPKILIIVGVIVVIGIAIAVYFMTKDKTALEEITKTAVNETINATTNIFNGTEGKVIKL